MRELHKLVEWRRKFVENGVRLTNRITDAKGYYPQVLDWFTDKNTLVFCDFLTQYPTLEAAQQAEPKTLNQFFISHRCRSTKTNARRIERIKSSTPLTNDRGVIEPSQMIGKALALQLRTLLLSIEQLNHKIEQLCKQLPDANLFAALPGAGEHLAPRLLLAFGEERSRFTTAQDLLQYAGIADGHVPSFCARALWSGWSSHGNTRFGQRRFMRLKSARARRIRKRFELWRLSGFGLSGVAGRIGSPMTRPNTCWRLKRRGRHW